MCELRNENSVRVREQEGEIHKQTAGESLVPLNSFSIETWISRGSKEVSFYDTILLNASQNLSKPSLVVAGSTPLPLRLRARVVDS